MCDQVLLQAGRRPRSRTIEKNLRFAVIPKVAHPWFDEVSRGAKEQAELLNSQLTIDISVDCLVPSSADVLQQNAILKMAADSKLDGIAIDPVAPVGDLHEIEKIRNQGVPVILFDSPSPGFGMTSVGNDFTQQGTIAATRLAELIGGRGKVAVMQGVPMAPNHKERFDAQLAALKAYPGIAIVDGGVDNDNIEMAKNQARSVLASNSDLKGYLCCDAAGPIGIAEAIREANKVGEVRVVGMDGIRPILEAIKQGVLESSSSTIPRMQGSISILMLWQASLGVRTPRMIDTGIDLITQQNVDLFLAMS